VTLFNVFGFSGLTYLAARQAALSLRNREHYTADKYLVWTS